MGKIDVLSRKFLEAPEVFADLCNLLYFQNRPVVRPGALSPFPGEASVVLGQGGRCLRVLTRRRDVLKQFAATPPPGGGSGRVLFGMEAQSASDPEMPLRMALYDTLCYTSQIEQLARGGLWDRRPGGRRAAGLVPVRTAVVYFGPGSWDAPTRIDELLDHPESWPGRPLAHEIDVLSLAGLDDRQLEGKCDALRCVAKCLRCSLDKRAIAGLGEDGLFRRVPNSVVDLVNAILNTNIKKDRHRRTTDMCKGMMELLEDTRAEGRAEGEAKGRAEGEAKGRAEGEAKERAKSRRGIRRLVGLLRKNQIPEPLILSSLTQGFFLKPEEAKSFL